MPPPHRTIVDRSPQSDHPRGETRWVAAFRRARRANRNVAVLGFNRPRQVMQYRRLIAASASWDEALDFARSQS